MDLELPKLDGWEATRRIKAYPPTSHIPILVLAHSSVADVKNAANAGCNGYESKPIAYGRLMEKVETAAGSAEVRSTGVAKLLRIHCKIGAMEQIGCCFARIFQARAISRRSRDLDTVLRSTFADHKGFGEAFHDSRDIHLGGRGADIDQYNEFVVSPAADEVIEPESRLEAGYPLV